MGIIGGLLLSLIISVLAQEIVGYFIVLCLKVEVV